MHTVAHSPPIEPFRSSNALRLRVASGEPFEVRRVVVDERISSLFTVRLELVSPNPGIELDAIVGHPAEVSVGDAHGATRTLRGIAAQLEQTAIEDGGLSTFAMLLVPQLWLLTQRRNYRMFQQLSELEIVLSVLQDWGIVPHLEITGEHKKREYRVQYAETDFAFMSRMLEDAGIAFTFREMEDETRLVLSDAPHAGRATARVIPYRAALSAHDTHHETVSGVRVGQRVRPGRYTLRDHDTRLASTYVLISSAVDATSPIEQRLERYHYVPGAFLFGMPEDQEKSAGDDRGKSRSDERTAASLMQKRLDAQRAERRYVAFETNALDVAPGTILSITGHPRADLSADRALLVLASRFEGTPTSLGIHTCEAAYADVAFRPALTTQKPKVSGVESATVVGPAGDEIHTDEAGRVRVHFHWDRESRRDERSSPWIPVSQSWGGAGYGGSNLPRIGQEVIVDFLGGDPDRPVITGRVYTNEQKTPYALPANKTQSGWKSCSTQGTGGYNEIMFEDMAGKELLRMQAEKDLDKLVKNDEAVVIGRDRQKLVKRDDRLTVKQDRRKAVDRDEDVAVGNDRTETVGNDEQVTIGRDRTKLVKKNDDLTIGGNRNKLVKKNESEIVAISRTRTVGVNEAVAVGVSQQIKIGSAQTVDVGRSQSVKVGKTQDVKVGGTQSVSVGKMANEKIGLTKTLTVGLAYQVSVGAAMNTTVGGMQAEQVGMTKTVTVGDKLEMICGKAKVTLEKEGKITWEIDGGAKIVLDDKDVLIQAGGGGSVVVVGGPDVHVNP